MLSYDRNGSPVKFEVYGFLLILSGSLVNVTVKLWFQQNTCKVSEVEKEAILPIEYLQSNLISAINIFGLRSPVD